MRHLAWTRAGRRLELPTGQRVYRAFLGQENLELDDGSFAPFHWNADARVLRYGATEARFEGDRVEFWRGGELKATTRPRLQRRTGRGWRDEAAKVRVDRLRDEDDLRAWSHGRIAIVLESEAATAQHIIVAGGRDRARGDTELVARLPGEYRVVLEHDLGGTPAREVRSGGACGAIAANGWRVAWTAEEALERDVEVTPRGISITLAYVRRARGQRSPARVLVSPDTYGPVANAGAGDDSQSDASAFHINGVTSGSGYIDFLFVDDSDPPQSCVSLRWASVDLEGLPASIDSGSGIIGDRTNGPGDGGNGHVLRFRCEQSNSPATGADTGDTTTGRPFLRTYLAANSEHTYNQGTTTVSPDLTTALQGLVTAGYSYSGASSDAIMITAGASDMWGITSVSWAHVGADVNHPTCDPIELSIVYTLGVATNPRTLYLTSTATNSPSPTTSFLLEETNASSGTSIEAGTWTDAAPGNADAGQFNPGLSPATADELDSTADADVTIRGSTAATATNNPTSPAGTQVGDMVIVIHWTRNGAGVPTHTLQSGFTEIRSHGHDDGSTDGRLSVAYRIATSSGANGYNAYTSSAGTDYAGIIVLQAGTFDPTTIADVQTSATTTGTGASNPPSVTTPVARCMVMAIAAYHLVSAATFNMTPPTNYTETWEMAGSVDVELAVATRILAAAGAEDAAAWTDNGTPNGSSAMVLVFRPNGEQKGTGRRGWLWNQDLTGKVMLGGTWGFQLRLSAVSGSGETGRVCARVTIVKPVSGAWQTVKTLFTTRVTGAPSTTLGQAGWRDQEESRLTVTSTPTDFDITIAGALGHTFAADERILIELGFCDAGAANSREWALHFNTADSFVTTPGIEVDDGVSAELAATLGAITAAATAELAIDATASPAVGAITAAATGELAIDAAASPTVGAVTVAAAGELAIEGTATAPIGAVTLEAEVSLETSTEGALDQPIGAITLAAAGELAIDAMASPTVGAVTVAAAGELAIEGSATPTVGAVGVAGTAELGLEGSLAQPIGTVGIAASADLDIAAQASPAVGPVTASATAEVALEGALAGPIGAVTLDAQAGSDDVLTPTLTAPVGTVGLSATADLDLEGDLARPVGAVGVAAVADLGIEGQAAAGVGEVALAAAGELVVGATVDAELGPVAGAGAVTLAIEAELGATLGPVTLDNGELVFPAVVQRGAVQARFGRAAGVDRAVSGRTRLTRRVGHRGGVG